MNHKWIQSFPAAIIVCDVHGIILEMNDKAIDVFKEDGGEKLLGKDILECHPEPARSQLAEMLKTGKPNYYTIEKRGVKKLIYQVPWYRDGTYAGFVELSLPIPSEMPHFIRA
ncbi:MAG: PAS domain-containing protein [Bacteroidota bacterium]|jgi:transcriptional regulator with PAS, ATPase and Fis domain